MNSRNYIHQVLIALDQVLNTLLAGYADETLSARAYRMSKKKARWKFVKVLIDGIFFWQDQHCYRSYLKEFKKGHRPAHYYTDEEPL